MQNDEDFKNLVAQAVRGNLGPEESVHVYADENVARLYNCLVALKKDVEVQLTNQKSRWAKNLVEEKRLGHVVVSEYSQKTKRNETRTLSWDEYVAEESDWKARAIKFLVSIEEHLSVARTRYREQDTKWRTEVMDMLMSIDERLDILLEDYEDSEEDENGEFTFVDEDEANNIEESFARTMRTE